MNKLILKGKLVRLHKFSDKVGTATIKVSSEANGQEYTNSFNVTVFAANLGKLSQVPLESEVTIEGKLKNGMYEKDGVKTWKLEILMNSFTHQAEVGEPTRIARMSPNDPKYRQNSDFREELDSIPF